MALIGKLIGYVEISSEGHVIHDYKAQNTRSSFHRSRQDGAKVTSKQIIEVVDEKIHMAVLKGDRKLATWTFDYEKLNASVPYPTALMDFVCTVTKDLDVHTSKK
ncbi:hypothetical protein LXL04_011356 [Taraxacum kok-saghyz]